MLLLADEDSSEEQTTLSESVEIENEAELKDTYFQLSTQAATGQFSSQTLKFKGLINGFPISVLVDTGSTHNIMQPRIAHHLNLNFTPITQFSVMVGDGSHLHCEGICNNVKLVLHNKPFNLPFYLLPIEGANSVLGMAWLRTLGPIQAYFSIPFITFTHLDKPMTLKGDPKSQPTSTTFHQFRQLINTNSIASFHLMLFQPLDSFPQPTTTNINSLPTNLSPKISNLLQRYKPIF